jgi:type I restriction enzyme S subunit
LYNVYGANGIIGKYNEYNHEEPVVAITCRGATCGNIHITEKFSYVNGNAMCLDNLDETRCLKKYLYYCLQNYYMNSIISGSAQPQITIQGLSKVEIKLYELEKQREIIRKFENIEQIISIRKKQLLDLDNLIKSQFVEMFGDPDFNTYKYEIVRLNEIAELNKGITYSPKDVVNDNGIIVLRSSNIKGSEFDLKDIVRINKRISSDKLVKENDILMCNRNGSARLVGKVAKIPKKEFDMTFGTFMTIVRSDIFEYLFAFFQTENFRRQIQFQTAVAINQISLPLLASVSVPLPPIEKINVFSKFVQQIDKQKFEIQKSLDEIQNLYESLMNEYFG